MKVTTEKEQLKAVVKQAMISVLEDDVYGIAEASPGWGVFDRHTAYEDDLSAAYFVGIPAYAARPARPALAATTTRGRKRPANRPTRRHQPQN